MRRSWPYKCLPNRTLSENPIAFRKLGFAFSAVAEGRGRRFSRRYTLRSGFCPYAFSFPHSRERQRPILRPMCKLPSAEIGGAFPLPHWSRRRESNPRSQLGRLVSCHCTTAADSGSPAGVCYTERPTCPIPSRIRGNPMLHLQLVEWAGLEPATHQDGGILRPGQLGDHSI